MNEAISFWKTAHVLSAAILFGTGLGIAFFCWLGSAVPCGPLILRDFAWCSG